MSNIRVSPRTGKTCSTCPADCTAEFVLPDHTFTLCDRCQAAMMNRAARARGEECAACNTSRQEIARLNRWIKVIKMAANTSQDMNMDVYSDLMACLEKDEGWGK